MIEPNALPHPLGKFAINGRITDAFAAQTLVDFIADATLLESNSRRAIGARWFLLESRQTFFVACDGAGIDADRLRDHLRKTLPCESEGSLMSY